MKNKAPSMKPEDITNIAFAVDQTQQHHWDTVHGRMEGMLTTLNTIVNQGAKLLQRSEASATHKPAPPLCRDCLHCKPGSGMIPFTKDYRFAQCLRPKPNDVNRLVHPDIPPESAGHCCIERKTFGEGKHVITCGEHAQFFVSKRR